MSYYLTKPGKHYLNRLGCQEGRRLRRGKSLRNTIVLLAFGRPVRRSGNAFGASLSDLQWVIDAYAPKLTCAATCGAFAP